MSPEIRAHFLCLALHNFATLHCKMQIGEWATFMDDISAGDQEYFQQLTNYCSPRPIIRLLCHSFLSTLKISRLKVLLLWQVGHGVSSETACKMIWTTQDELTVIGRNCTLRNRGCNAMGPTLHSCVESFWLPADHLLEAYRIENWSSPFPLLGKILVHDSWIVHVMNTCTVPHIFNFPLYICLVFRSWSSAHSH